ncbi:uncharacterized protein DMENIID0001_062700 [Sergentomyia squamirostris]
MPYHVEWLKIGNSRNFGLCWLAATNPTAFRKEVSKGQLERVKIGKIGDELLKMIKTKSAKKRISLFVTANLAFGSVKIYEKLVNNLFEDVFSYFVVQSEKLQRISQQDEENIKQRAKKRLAPQETVQQKIAKRRKIQETDENNNQAVLTSATEDITLREDEFTPPAEFPAAAGEDLEENFGEVGEFDLELDQEFNFRESNGQRGACSGESQAMKPVEENGEFHGFPEEVIFSIASSVSVENPNPEFKEPVQSIEEFLTPLPWEKPKKRKNGKKITQIDQVTIIPGSKMENQMIRYDDTMRCSTGRNDIVDLNVQKDLLLKPTRKRHVEPLKELFQRNLKIPRLEDHILDFLVEILPREIDPNNNLRDPEEAFADVLADFAAFKDTRATRRYPAPREPSDEISDIPPSSPPPPVSPISVPTIFSEIPSENTDIEKFTKETILYKLQHFWRRSRNPIDMNVLLGLMGEIRCRKIASRIFLILLELHKSQQVQLHGKDGSLEIGNITPGNLFTSSPLIY